MPATISVVTGVWDELLGRYLGWLEGEGRRPHTVRGYRTDLAGLVARLGYDASGGRGLTGWVESLEALAPATRARRLSAARGCAGGSVRIPRPVNGPVRGRHPRQSPPPRRLHLGAMRSQRVPGGAFPSKHPSPGCELHAVPRTS